MAGAEKSLEEESVGVNGESTAGSHHLELGIVILLLLHRENGRALGSSWDVETPLVLCVQKSRNIQAASCHCLFPAANQEE